jgi:Tfp pilus assembly protein PilX
VRKPQRGRTLAAAGFTLLPVVLAMSLIGAIAFMLNRDNGLNSNLIGSQSDLARARYAAEAGLQSVNYTIQALGCAGSYPILSSPVTDSNFGGAAYSAYANNTSGSPLTLTSTGTYNGASVTLTKTNAYVYQAAGVVNTWPWVTQPNSASSKDTAVNPGSPNSNYGGSNEIRLDGGGRELLIQFDLSPLRAGSKIVPWYGAGPLQPGAKLMLHRNNSGSATESIYVMLITRSWSETYATWNSYTLASAWPSPGVGYDLRPVSTNPYLTVSTWQSLDLTNAAIAWMNGLYPNNGVWIRAGPLVSNAKFALASDIDSTVRPALVVYYLLPCGATAPPWAT